MAQAVNRRPLVVEVDLRSHVSPYENCGGQGNTGTGFSPSTSSFSLSVSIIPSVLRSHVYPHVAFSRRTSGRSLGTFHKPMFRGHSPSIG
jgi:hypothetical protein